MLSKMVLGKGFDFWNTIPTRRPDASDIHLWMSSPSSRTSLGARIPNGFVHPINGCGEMWICRIRRGPMNAVILLVAISMPMLCSA